jgi:hypothetical protein
MIGRLLTALACVACLPALALAVARPPEPRLRPADTAENPSYVQRVEPAIVALRVKADPDAASSARLGVNRFASGVIFDPRGYAVTVSYALIDAEPPSGWTRSCGAATGCRPDWSDSISRAAWRW